MDEYSLHANTTRLTNEVGNPVADNNTTQTAGERGPLLVQDTWYFEKVSHFDREVIPERRMHAKGSGAYGTFTVTNDISRLTKAKVLQPGASCEVFVRFSTVAGERGSSDTVRDIRGFAVKFYTEEGNWDLVGNNTPVFFIRDPKKFVDLNHVIKRDPQSGLHSAQQNWDFWSSLPEALHQLTYQFGDRGIPRSFRHMHGFGSHTFSLFDQNNKRTWVKFHWVCQQGVENITNEEAERINMCDLDANRRDLFNAIEAGDYPRWKLCIQVMDEATAKKRVQNPFDITKVWSHKEFPLIEVGVMELNRNPLNFFAEVEQAAFSPTHIPPGIGLSPDKLLQGRLLSYTDAQNYRIGVNFNHIPVNRPRVEYAEFHRDGAMRTDGNYGSTVSYEPNSHGQWQQQPEAAQPPLDIIGPADAWSPLDNAEDDWWTQPGDLWRLITEPEKERMIMNFAADMGLVSDNVKYRHAAHCYRADEEYGTRLALALNIDPDRVAELSKLPHEQLMAATGQIVAPHKRGGVQKKEFEKKA